MFNIKEQEKDYLVSALLFNVVEALDTTIRQEKRNERHPHWKGRSKTICIYRRHYIENPKDSTKKLLELISKFGKVTGQINIQDSIVFL